MTGRGLGQHDVQVDRRDVRGVRNRDIVEHHARAATAVRTTASNRAATSGSSEREEVRRAGRRAASPRSSRALIGAGFDTPRERLMQDGRVLDRSAQRADVIERAAERHDAVESGSRRSAGFSPTRPQAAAGMRIEPPVSVPIEA